MTAINSKSIQKNSKIYPSEDVSREQFMRYILKIFLFDWLIQIQKVIKRIEKYMLDVSRCEYRAVFEKYLKNISNWLTAINSKSI